VDFAIRLRTLGRERGAATLRRRAIVGEVFTPRELRLRIVRPSGLRLMQPLDLSLSPESWENVCLLVPPPPEVRLEPATGSYFPHVLLQRNRSVFTSVCLALEKGH
jgi:hypothetical protein